MSANSTSKRRNKRSRDSEDDDESNLNDREYSLPPNISRLMFLDGHPNGLDRDFAAAIFELGLKHSSPKVLVPLMPTDCDLSTEHIKSHLQKYRIHRQRSKEEFYAFYDKYIAESFTAWQSNKGWDKPVNNGVVGAPNSRISKSLLQEGYAQTPETLSEDNLVSEVQKLQLLKKSLTERLKLIAEWKSLGFAIGQECAKVSNEIKAGIEEVISIGDT